jgi:hypothetical protein
MRALFKFGVLTLPSYESEVRHPRRIVARIKGALAILIAQQVTGGVQ